MDLFIKLVMLVIFFGVMIGIGLYCRRHKPVHIRGVLSAVEPDADHDAEKDE